MISTRSRRDFIATTTLLAAVGLANSTASADEVTLNSGERLTGEVTSQNDNVVTLDHPVLGTLQINRDQVQTVQTDEAAQAPQPAAPKSRFSTWVLPSFAKTFEAGFNGAEGNSQNFSAFLAFNATSETDFDRWDITARYFRSSSDNVVSQNEVNATILKEWLRPEQRHFWFTRANYQYDQFESWEHRVGAYGGIGYTFFDTPTWELDGRAGAGPQYEFGSVNEVTWEALLELDAAYHIAENHKIAGYNRLFPSLSEGGEFRNITGLAWTYKINRARGLSLKLGAENEYDSDPSEGDKKNDVKYYGALVFEF